MGKIKEILCMHHSHLDIGYTHPQEMVMELQQDYISQALELCLKTEDWPEDCRFRWTCEASLPLLKWFEEAEERQKQEFRRMAACGMISVTAFPMHTTPGCTSGQLMEALECVDEVRRLTGSRVTTAVNHDVNGQPWTIAPFLIESGVEFYITGMNIHFGGIPFPRPYVFQWECEDGRKLLTFLGEHYSMFSHFFSTQKEDVNIMRKGIEEYVRRVEDSGWEEDYVFLTATNYPLVDNNPPDEHLAELIKEYNNSGAEQKIRFVTPEMLLERVRKAGREHPCHRGDWTDYWNFGSGSTPQETMINRKTKRILAVSDFVQCMNGKKESARRRKLRQKAYVDTLLFDEHTWGAADSVSDPCAEQTRAQLNKKRQFAYEAGSLAVYLEGMEMEEYACNPEQAASIEGVCFVNPSDVEVWHEVYLPEYMLKEERSVRASRIKDFLPYDREKGRTRMKSVKLAPFSVKKVPIRQLEPVLPKLSGEIHIEAGGLETPWYKVILDREKGKICQIYDKKRGIGLIGQAGGWDFFGMVKEHTAGELSGTRSAFFPRDFEKGYRNISCWDHEWESSRQKFVGKTKCWVEETEEEAVVHTRIEAEKGESLETKIIFSVLHDRIILEAELFKNPEVRPEGIYFTFPLKLRQGWKCVYDTADTFVHLDEEQIGNVCRDHITVDRTVSLYDQEHGYILACPDAPLVQIGGFHFGRELRSVDRKEDPLLLAWPMNNYWDTNFAASQEGKMHFRYELSVFDKFTSIRAYKAGIQAASVSVTAALAQCACEEEMRAVYFESDTASLLRIVPYRGGKAWMLLVKNHGGTQAECRIRIPHRQIVSAEKTDILGQKKSLLEVAGDCVKAAAAPKAFEFYLIRFRQDETAGTV